MDIRAEVLDEEGEDFYREPDTFVADTPTKLDWCLRKIHADLADMARLKEAKERDDELYTRAISSKADGVERMRSLISQGMKAQDLSKHAGIDGMAYFTQEKPRPTVQDEEVLEEWVIEHEVRARAEGMAALQLSKSGCIKYVKETGEVLPGMVMTDGGERLTVKGV